MPRTTSRPDGPSLTGLAILVFLSVLLVWAAPMLFAQAPQPQPLPPQTLDQWAASKAARDDFTITSAELSLVPGNTPAVAAYNTKRRRDVLDAMIRARKAAPGGYAKWIKTYFPDRTSVFDRPFLGDAPALAFRGDGLNTTWQMLYGRDDSLLICGVGNPVLSPDHFFPVAGLDASVTASHWGLRTMADLHLAHSGGCLSYPAGYWATSSGFALNFALDTTTIAPHPADAVGGLCNGQTPYPAYVFIQNGQLYLYVGSAQADGSVWVYAANEAMPTTLGVHRFTVQYDLTTGLCIFIIDGKVTYPLMGSASHGRMPPGCRFPANETMPFLVGALGEGANSTGGAAYFKAPSDLALMGFSCFDRPIYRQDGKRIDGLADNDQLRYYTAGPGTVGLLPFDQQPAEVAASRLVNVLSGPAAGTGPRGSCALALSLDHATPFAAIGGYDIQGIKFYGSTWSPWGAALSLGYALYVDARDCTFAGGAHGVAGLRFGANYPVSLRDCAAAGSDAALFNRYGMWTVTNLHVPTLGRTTIRNETGLIKGTNWFMEPNGTPAWIYQGTEGARFIGQDIAVDIEGGIYPTGGYFYAEGGPNDPGGLGGSFKLTDVSLGKIQPQQTILKLRDGDVAGFCRVDINSLAWVGGPDRKRLIDAQGSRWRGTIRVDQAIPDCPTIPGVEIITPETHPTTQPAPVIPPPVLDPAAPVIRPTIRRAA